MARDFDAILAVGGGTGVWWFAAAFVISAVQAIARFAFVIGKVKVRLPPRTQTRSGDVTYIVASAVISLIALVCLLSAL